jgi:MFS transporter, PPP family, 3-phenylpropionic acid transporter
VSLLTLRAYFFFCFGTVGLYVPYFPTWLVARGFRGLELSAFLCLPPLGSLVAPLLLGMLSDRLGIRGRLITFTASLATLGMAGLSIVATEFSPLPLTLALSGFAVFALFRAPMLSLGDVMAMENDPNFGRTRLWGSLGFIVNAWLGGRFLDPHHPLQIPLAVAGGLALSWLISLGLPKTAALPPRPALDDAREFLSDLRFHAFLLMACLAYAALSAYDFTSTFRLRELGAPGYLIGTYWATATTAEVVLFFFSARIFALFSAEKLLPWTLALGSLRWFGMAELNSPWLLILIQPLHAVVFGLFLLCTIDILKRRARGRGMGTAQGLLSVATSVGAVSGLAAWGTLHAAHGSRFVFYVASGLSMGGLLASLAVSPADPQEPAFSS